MKSGNNIVQPHDVRSSVTAMSVARGFARAALTEYGHLVDVNEAMLINHLTDVGGNSLRGMIWMLGKTIAMLPYSLQQSFFNHTVIPAYDQVIMLRKLMIKQKIDAAIASGVKQIVFLGGGYDIRGLVTAMNYIDVNVFEVDRGPTRKSKLEGLSNIPQGIGFDYVQVDQRSKNLTVVNSNMYYINADLSIESLDVVLIRNGFNRDQPAIFIAEGLTVYLNEDANRALLKSIHASIPFGSELIIGYSADLSYSQLTKAVQSSSNELYQFMLPMVKVAEFAAEFGFAVNQKFSPSLALADIGDPNVECYRAGSSKPLETYYILSKQDMVPVISMDDVPEIKLVLPPKPENRTESSYCSMM